MKSSNLKVQKKDRRHARIRAKVIGSATTPRLAVFKSNTALTVQAIDDAAGKTLAFATSRGVKGTDGFDTAKKIGATLAATLKAQGIETAVFDRGGFRYTGRIAALADGAREAGLAF